MLFYTLSARYRLLFIAALLPSLTITMPTEQTLVRCWLAVSKSIAAKSFIPLSSFLILSADYQKDSSPASFGYCHAGW